MCRVRWYSYEISHEGNRTEYDERKARRLWEKTVDEAEKAEYGDFESWLFDMERFGILNRYYIPEC